MENKILSVAAVTGNFPDGQKITGVRIRYSGDPSASFRQEQLQVEGRHITAVRIEGDTVIAELAPRDEKAVLIPPPPKPPKDAGGPPPQKKGPPNLPPAVRLPVEVTVTINGVSYKSDRTIEPVVEQFRQLELDGMGYNLYVPALEEGKTYPLVLFIHDAGACGADTKITLSQGNGAVSFADAKWQSEHPCFVLAPQVDKYPYGPMTNDDFEVTPDFDRVKAILDFVMEHYPVDAGRVYTSGQSMGCMASCEMNIRYPDLFAASLLVAGQWSPERMAESCARNKLWILVSEHDAKAFPGMNAVTEAMEKAGAKVGRYRWDAKNADLEAEVCKVLDDDVNVHYTVYEGSSVVPAGADPNPGANHMATWPVTYQINALKQWLFSNSK